MKLRTVVGTVLAIYLVESASDWAASANELLAYGEHLAQECVTCHRRDGSEKSGGIPPIVGLESDYFIQTMNFYKSGDRTNQAMVSVARSLDESQIKALAAYFATQRPARK